MTELADTLKYAERDDKALADRLRRIQFGILRDIESPEVPREMIAATLTGDPGKPKRLQIAAHARAIITGKTPPVVAIGAPICVVTLVPELPVPAGGIWVRVTVPVNWTMPWQPFVRWAAPQTEETWDILKLEDPYPSVKTGTTLEEFHLLYYPKATGTKVGEALRFAEPLGFESAHGRAPLAIIGNVPDLVAQVKPLGFRYADIGVVTPAECLRRVADAWCYSNGDRDARVGSVESDWHGNYWFAFRRKCLAP